MTGILRMHRERLNQARETLRNRRSVVVNDRRFRRPKLGIPDLERCIHSDYIDVMRKIGIATELGWNQNTTLRIEIEIRRFGKD